MASSTKKSRKKVRGERSGGREDSGGGGCGGGGNFGALGGEDYEGGFGGGGLLLEDGGVDGDAAGGLAEAGQKTAQRGGQNYNDCFSLLVCSASGSGKSTLIENLCETEPLSKKPVFVFCNNKTFNAPNGASDYAASLLPRAKPITLEEAARSLRNAILVIEDIQNFDNRELTLVKQLLFFCRRHRFLHLFFACHVLLKSNMVNIIGNFDAVVVLKHGDNDRAFKSIAAARGFDRLETAKKWLELMKSKPWSMMVFTARDGKRAKLLETRRDLTIDYLTSGGGTEDETSPKRHLQQEAVDQMLRTFKNPRGAIALFQFIINSHGNFFDPADYSLRMRNQKRRVLECSLFDYLAVCLGEEEPDSATVALHNALARKIVIPKHLVCAKMRKIAIVRPFEHPKKK